MPVRRANAIHRTACVIPQTATRCTSESSSVGEHVTGITRSRVRLPPNAPTDSKSVRWKGRKPRGSNPPSGCTSASAPGGAPVHARRCRWRSRPDAHRSVRTARDAALRTGRACRRQAPGATIMGGDGSPAPRRIEIVIARPRAPRECTAGARPLAWGVSHPIR